MDTRNAYALPLEHAARNVLHLSDRNFEAGADADAFEHNTIGSMVKVLEQTKSLHPDFSQAIDFFKNRFGSHAGKSLRELTSQDDCKKVLEEAKEEFTYLCREMGQ